MRIGIIGGTGKEGRGMAQRWAKAGHDVRIGSRDAARARATALELGDASGTSAGSLQGGDDAWAVNDAEVVLLSVPCGAHGNTLTGLEGRSRAESCSTSPSHCRPRRSGRCTCRRGWPPPWKRRHCSCRGCGSWPPCTTLAPPIPPTPSTKIDCDVLACSDDPEALQVSLSLIADLGLRGFDAGPLCNAVALESLTLVLLHLNRHSKGSGAGIRLTGV